ncbi:hypothetical protein M422DRAFT_270601 [Sphaerobolus stellatus SS14]|uniref:Ndc10 domain-containing protein n=1 Tax=Sphaerobolus stellatus (strain SS14) TaxID=990650 RepID=A0A0C9U245_SPHS4|nr:hypothetical protein M422DRAFT_270601 [Sphaerobolus stellatus SS14]
MEALLGVAYFDAQKPESHFLARDALEPPEDKTPEAKDIALQQFLNLFNFLHCVLIQDLAVLFEVVPSCEIFCHSPFNTLSFQQFAQTVSAQLEEAAEGAQLALENLPEQLANMLKGYIAEDAIVHKQENQQLQLQITGLQEDISHLGSKIEIIQIGPPKKKQCHTKGSL